MDTGNNKKGFTLIELLVVLAIFSIMLTAITSVFISGITVQKNSIAQEQLIDQVNYAVDYMTRSIMMAKKINGDSCQTKDKYFLQSGSSLQFVNMEGNSTICVRFYLISDTIVRNDYSSPLFPLVSDDIKITKLSFNVLGDVTGAQPKVTMLIEAESKSGNPVQKLKIQTTISPRDLNK